MLEVLKLSLYKNSCTSLRGSVRKLFAIECVDSCRKCYLFREPVLLEDYSVISSLFCVEITNINDFENSYINSEAVHTSVC